MSDVIYILHKDKRRVLEAECGVCGSIFQIDCEYGGAEGTIIYNDSLNHHMYRCLNCGLTVSGFDHSKAE